VLPNPIGKRRTIVIHHAFHLVSTKFLHVKYLPPYRISSSYFIRRLRWNASSKCQNHIRMVSITLPFAFHSHLKRSSKVSPCPRKILKVCKVPPCKADIVTIKPTIVRKHRYSIVHLLELKPCQHPKDHCLGGVKRRHFILRSNISMHTHPSRT